MTCTHFSSLCSPLCYLSAQETHQFILQFIRNLHPFQLNARLMCTFLGFWGGLYSRYDEKCLLAVLSLKSVQSCGHVCALKSNQKITFSLIQCFVFTPISFSLLPSGQSRMDQFSEGFVLKNIYTNKKHKSSFLKWKTGVLSHRKPGMASTTRNTITLWESFKEQPD